MKDVGPDVRRTSAPVAKLASNVQGMMAQWTENNFVYFEQTMELIRENAPVQYAKLYMDAVKLGIIKETNINFNFSRQEDRQNLQALVRTRVHPSLPDSGEYIPFEEIKPKKIPLKREGE
jgi:hypothetical protein